MFRNKKSQRIMAVVIVVVLVLAMVVPTILSIFS
jgi:flagellar basal body-associated protein FliL